MSLISLQNSSELEVTILSNRFIDNFMPRANGEFVKVYIYLLRMVSAAPSSFSLEHMADSLFCTERDISRALKYWEGEKLIALTYTADQKLSGITLLEPFADTGHRESSASVDTFTGSGNSASVQAPRKYCSLANFNSLCAPIRGYPTIAVFISKSFLVVGGWMRSIRIAFHCTPENSRCKIPIFRCLR